MCVRVRVSVCVQFVEIFLFMCVSVIVNPSHDIQSENNQDRVKSDSKVNTRGVSVVFFWKVDKGEEES